MAFGPTLIGALIGAAVGVGLHQFIEVGLQREAAWFAVVIGLLTGLGVRQANKSLIGKVSYLRGAITGLIALGAIVGSIQLVSVLASRKGAADAGKPLADAKATAEDADEEATEDDGKAAEVAETPERVVQPVAATGGGGKVPGTGEPNIAQFIFMALGAFLAYELGRGSGTSPAVVTSEPAPGEPVMTDPSN